MELFYAFVAVDRCCLYYTFVNVGDLPELTEINENTYIVVTDGSSSKKIKARLLTPALQIGTVSTLVEGSNATVNMSYNNGVYTINFGIPRGASSGSTSSGMTDAQLNQLNIAYAHSQTTHVQLADIPTKVSELENDSSFVTLNEMTTAINDAKLEGGNTDIDLSSYQLIQDNTLNTTAKTIPTAINELKSIIDVLQDRVAALENQQGTTVRVTGVSLNNNTLTLNVGNTSTLTATVTPSNATNKAVTWSTNNSAVASVNNGVITAISNGTAIITVTTIDGNYSASCTVTVNTTTPSQPSEPTEPPKPTEPATSDYITTESGDKLLTEDGLYLKSDV